MGNGAWCYASHTHNGTNGNPWTSWMMKWLRSIGCPWDSRTCTNAAGCGALDVLKWAIENGCDHSIYSMTRSAVYNGAIDVMEWLYATGRLETPIVCDEAIVMRNMTVLRWAREHGCKFSATSMEYAINTGEIEIVRYLVEEKCAFNRQTCIEKCARMKLPDVAFGGVGVR